LENVRTHNLTSFSSVQDDCWGLSPGVCWWTDAHHRWAEGFLYIFMSVLMWLCVALMVRQEPSRGVQFVFHKCCSPHKLIISTSELKWLMSLRGSSKTNPHKTWGLWPWLWQVSYILPVFKLFHTWIKHARGTNETW